MEKPKYWILSFSGGKDSTAMLLEWLKRREEDPAQYPLDEVMFCDTTIEFPAMIDHVHHVGELVKKAGVKFTILKNEHPFEYYMLEYMPKRKDPKFKGEKGHSWPGPKIRWCTRMMKLELIRKYLADLNKQYDVIQLIGIAVDEQYRLEREHNKNESHRHPLAEWGWTEAQCLQYCYDRGYTFGGLYEIFNRVSCWCCPMQSLSELKKLRSNFPDLWKQLLEWDSQTWRSFRTDYTLPQLEVRFAFEDERIAEGKPINHTKEFMTEMRKRFELAGCPQEKKAD